jgi:hypothetical protein
MGDVGSKCIGEHPDGHTTPHEQKRLLATSCHYRTIATIETELALSLSYNAKLLPANLPAELITKILYYALDIDSNMISNMIPISKCVPLGYEATGEVEETNDNTDESTGPGLTGTVATGFEVTDNEHKDNEIVIEPDPGMEELNPTENLDLDLKPPHVSGACECLSFATQDFGRQYLFDQGIYNSKTSHRQLSICAVCFGIVRCTVCPKISNLINNGGRHHFILERNIIDATNIQPYTRLMTWRNCRHFQFDQDPGLKIRRHRDSNYHSFRTSVASEWVLSGKVEYNLIFETDRALLALDDSGKYGYYFSAIAIGIVTPETKVNLSTSWVPGLSSPDDSWGFMVEDVIGGPDIRQEFAIDKQQLNRNPLFLSDNGKFSFFNTRVPNEIGLKKFRKINGNEFHVSVVIDYDVELLKLSRLVDGVWVTLSIPLVIRGRPIALGVGLKYANDSVRFDGLDDKVEQFQGDPNMVVVNAGYLESMKQQLRDRGMSESEIAGIFALKEGKNATEKGSDALDEREIGLEKGEVNNFVREKRRYRGFDDSDDDSDDDNSMGDSEIEDKIDWIFGEGAYSKE